jgi:hypothetical protein
VLPTFGTKLKPLTTLVRQNDALPPGDVADLSDGDTSDPRRYSLAGRSRKEQFVVFASMQGGLKIDFAGWFADGSTGYGLCTNLSPNSTFFTNMSEVGGEAIAQINDGGSQALLAKEISDGDAGLRVEMSGEVSRTKVASGDEQFESSRRPSEITGDIDAVAGFSARAQYGFTPRTGPDDDDISEDSARRLGNVASGEGHLKRIGLVQEAVEKPVNPALRQVSRQGQGQKRGNGPPSHGGNVAQSASEAPGTDNLGSVPFTPEMDPFQAEIGGDQSLVSKRDSQGGAVVADADANRCATFCPGAHSLDDRLFAESQANSIYKRRAT